jgi:uncharacterized membrane protein YtjA (UPF0391 family)
MLQLAVLFLLLAIISAIIGYGGLAGIYAGLFQILFFVFAVLFVITIIYNRR